MAAVCQCGCVGGLDDAPGPRRHATAPAFAIQKHSGSPSFVMPRKLSCGDGRLQDALALATLETAQ